MLFDIFFSVMKPRPEKKLYFIFSEIYYILAKNYKIPHQSVYERDIQQQESTVSQPDMGIAIFWYYVMHYLKTFIK